MTELSTAIPKLAERETRIGVARPVERDLSHVPPAAVDGLIALLSAPVDLDLDAVVVAMQTLSVDARALGYAVCEGRTQYVRTLLYRDEYVELLALTWLPDNAARCTATAHLRALCASWTVSGANISIGRASPAR